MKKKWESISEGIAIVAVMYYVAVRFYDSSRFVFTFFDLPRKITVGGPIVIATALRFIPCFLYDWTRSKEKKKLILTVVWGIVFGIPCLYIAYRYDYNFLAYLAFIPFCLYGIRMDRILKAFVITIGVLLVTTFFCSLTGVIDNRITASVSEKHLGNTRGSYGIVSSTDFAAYFVFFLMTYWCFRERKWGKWDTVCFCPFVVIIAYIIYIYTSSWTSIILCFLLLLIVIYERMETKRAVRNRQWRHITRITHLLTICSFPILGLFFYGMTWLYGHGNIIAIKLNGILDNRLMWAWTAFVKYGIHPFGTLTPQNGNGGDAIHIWQGSYDFIDSTFALLLIRYGWIFTILISILWIWMTRKALKEGRKRIAYAMAVISVHCLMEHHFPELNYNIFLAAPFCSLLYSSNTNTKSTREMQYHWVSWLTGGILVGIVIPLLPGLLSRAKYIIETNRWNTGEYSSFWATMFVFSCVVLFGSLWFYSSKLIISAVKGEKVKKCVLLGIIIPTCMLIGVRLGEEYIINTSTSYLIQLVADTTPIEIVLSSAKQPVYVDNNGEVYRRHLEGLSVLNDSFETLSKTRKGTVLVAKTTESYVLLHTGARYAAISDYTALYTYDEDVILALKTNGFRVSGYYYTEREADLKVLAQKNKLDTDSMGNICLEENDKLTEWPEFSLYGGTYRACFDISTNSNYTSGVVCDILIRTYGDNLITREAVLADDIDETGKLKKDILFNIDDSSGISFCIYSYVPLNISRISWRREETLDKWQSFDEYNRVIIERYYDSKGEPVCQPLGYYGVRYQYGTNSEWILQSYLDEELHIAKTTQGYAQKMWIYNSNHQMIEEKCMDEEGNVCFNTSGYAISKCAYDEDGNVNKYWYYDTQGQPVMIINGYAEMHRLFNNKRQIIREEYFDIEGEPTTRPQGHASVEYSYDEYGNKQSYRFFDTYGNPVIITGGWAEVRRVYNKQKQIIEESYYGTDGNIVLCRNGYAIVRYEYDYDGNIINERYYGINDEPVLKNGNYHEVHRTYDNKKKTKEEYYDLDGNPI